MIPFSLFKTSEKAKKTIKPRTIVVEKTIIIIQRFSKNITSLEYI